MNVLISTLYNDLQNQDLLRRLNLVKSVVGAFCRVDGDRIFLVMREGKFVWIKGNAEVNPEFHMFTAFVQAGHLLRLNGPSNVWIRCQSNPVTGGQNKLLLNNEYQRFAFCEKEVVT